MHKISFPGLGIGEFEINSTALKLGDLSIAWYGVIITTGIILAVLYIYLRGKRQKLLLDDLIDLAFFTVIPGIVGARLYYVFFDWLERPENYTSLEDVVAVWNGGLAIYGGIIFGALGCFIGLKIKKMRIPTFFDILAPAVQMAQAIGRWGNFMNGEAYGWSENIADLPWRMKLEGAYYTKVIDGVERRIPTEFVHPTFLYESLWNIIGVVVLTLYSKKKKFDGEIFLLYLGWYGLGRFFIEGLRTDSLYMGGLRVSQWLALVCFVASITLLVIFYFFRKLRTVADCIYTPEAKSYAIVNPAAQAEDAADGETAPTASDSTEPDNNPPKQGE
ncbi:MAG: prolipoprotein diacylglyceryl transferase [Clostridia bacterium]|nr:prolipoprotein diacylglyceryl transferase [Clostridia bacterium]